MRTTAARWIGRGGLGVLVLGALWTVPGCGGQGPALLDELDEDGKADVATTRSREADLPETLERDILPFFYAHAREGELTGARGYKIRWAALERSAATERGALLVIGGRGESYLKYAELAWDLRRSGLSLYFYDHRGQGLSERMLKDKQKGWVQEFDDYVTDLGQVIDGVVRARPHKKIFILAHSLGGAVASLYAERHAGVIDAMVLSAPMHQIDAGSLPEWAAYDAAAGLTLIGMGDRYAPGKGPWDKNGENDVSHSDVRYSMLSVHLRELFPEIVLGGPTNRWIKEAIEGSRAARDEDNASRIATPVMLFQAAGDQVVKPGGQDDFCAAAQACTKVVFEGAGHEILMETDAIRDRALDRALAFLR